MRVKVTLSAKLNASVPASAPLFVLVRDPRQAGPPLAVKRLTSQFPQTVELTTADSMLPGHTFAAGQLVEVVARVSQFGQPHRRGRATRSGSRRIASVRAASSTSSSTM